MKCNQKGRDWNSRIQREGRYNRQTDLEPDRKRDKATFQKCQEAITGCF